MSKTLVSKETVSFKGVSIGCTWDISLPRFTVSPLRYLLESGVCFVRISWDFFWYSKLLRHVLFKILFLVSAVFGERDGGDSSVFVVFPLCSFFFLSSLIWFFFFIRPWQVLSSYSHHAIDLFPVLDDHFRCLQCLTKRGADTLFAVAWSPVSLEIHGSWISELHCWTGKSGCLNMKSFSISQTAFLFVIFVLYVNYLKNLVSNICLPEVQRANLTIFCRGI